MAGFLSNSLSTDANGLAEAVGNEIDKNGTNNEDRKELENELSKAAMQYEIEKTQLGIEDKKVTVADIAHARESQISIQNSEYASWLAKNIHPLLAVSIIGLTFAMYFWIIQKGWKGIDQTGMKDIIIYILGALTTVSTQVAAFFFGSSQGSKDKQKAIENFTSASKK